MRRHGIIIWLFKKKKSITEKIKTHESGEVCQRRESSKDVRELWGKPEFDFGF